MKFKGQVKINICGFEYKTEMPLMFGEKNRKTGNKYSCHQLPFPSYPNLFRPTSPQLSLIATNAITR